MLNILRPYSRYFWPCALCAALCAIVFIPLTSAATAASQDSRFRVVYSLDHRDTDREIIRLIDSADRYVYFAIYYFSKADIAAALIRAKQRGAVVWGITDAAASLDTNKNVVNMLRVAGIPIETQKHQDGIMHMKAIVTDKAYASGSYNWTASATEANDESWRSAQTNPCATSTSRSSRKY